MDRWRVIRYVKQLSGAGTEPAVAKDSTAVNAK